MASSTAPHCSITTSKPYQTPNQLPRPSRGSNHTRGGGNGGGRTGHHKCPPHISFNKPSQTSRIPSTDPTTSAAASAAAAAAGTSLSSGNSRFPTLAPFCQSKSELGVEFCGRRSTRFVSKMRLGRPRPSTDSRHSCLAEEVLHRAVQLGSGDFRGIDDILLGFGPQLSRSTDDFTFLLRELGNLGECWKAIRCFEFAVQRVKKGSDQGKLASSMISTLGRLGKVDLARKVFDTAMEGGYGRSVYTFSALISAYGRNGYCGEAIKVFESLKASGLKPNLVTYNAVIDACAKGGVPFAQAGGIFDEMVRSGVQPDRITFNSLLAVCGRIGLWEAARILFDEMVCRGIDQDMFTFNTLIDALCKGGQMDLALGVMNEMSSKKIPPNVVTYSTLVDGYAKADRLLEALNLFNEMEHAGTGLDRVSYNTLLAIYARLGRFEEALNVCEEMERCGIEKDVVTYNALLGGYGKQGRYGEVKRVFTEMKAKHCCPNLLTYSTLVDVYAKGGLYKESMDVFKEFKQAGLEADVVLYSSLVDALCKNGLVESAVSLLDQMTKEGIRPNVVTYNSIIDAFGRPASMENTAELSAGATESQVDFMQDAAESEIGDWEGNQIIDMFGQLAADKQSNAKKDERTRHEIFCILNVFQKMHELDIRPNVVTFSAILNACSRCNSFEDASMLLEELRLFDNQVYGVAHGLLMGHKQHIWAQAEHLFDQVNLMDSSTASAFYNALTDMLWHFGQKRGAQLVVVEGKHRGVWENMWSESCLDLHLMSSGAARAIVHSWLLHIRSIVFRGHELPKLLSILTGWGKHSKVVGGGALRHAVGALLGAIGAPFRVAKCNAGRFVSTGDMMTAWLKDAHTLTVLVLHDLPTRPGFGTNFLALPMG